MAFHPLRSRAFNLRLWLAVLLSSLPAATAMAQPAPATKDAVIKPPPQVDPRMQVQPKSQAVLPTPVVKPPATVVPK